jgi:hypothetical protein
MKESEVTKMLLENQKCYLEAQNRNIEVLTQMKDALVSLNDTNVLHTGKEDARYETIKQLGVAVEARSKVMNTVFLILTAAIVILAGAEKALSILKIL